MTNVQMLVHITGGRADGTAWPQVGHDKPLKISKAEAEDLYRAQLARPWPGGQDEEPAVVAEEAAPEPAAVEVEPEPDVEPVPAGGPPKPVAPKADWIAWAVTQGATEEDASAATKQQLMEQYGARP